MIQKNSYPQLTSQNKGTSYQAVYRIILLYLSKARIRAEVSSLMHDTVKYLQKAKSMFGTHLGFNRH